MADGDATRRERRRVRLRPTPVAFAVVAVLVLAGLFFLGTRMPVILSLGGDGQAAAPSLPSTPTPTPTPSPTSTTGPQLPGTFSWNELRGGECITPYTSAWQQSFTVVDCAQPHRAQVMSTGPVSTDPAAAYPGQDAIADMMVLLCQNASAFNASILGAYPDVVLQGSYPVNAEQWASGMRNYYCFVSRSSSLPIVGDFAPAAG